ISGRSRARSSNTCLLTKRSSQSVKATTEADLGRPSITARSPTIAPEVRIATICSLTCGDTKATLSQPATRIRAAEFSPSTSYFDPDPVGVAPNNIGRLVAAEHLIGLISIALSHGLFSTAAAHNFR